MKAVRSFEMLRKKLPIQTHNKPEDLRSQYEKSFTTNEALQHCAISIV